VLVSAFIMGEGGGGGGGGKNEEKCGLKVTSLGLIGGGLLSRSTEAKGEVF
jgi:hypothetical protein